MFKKTICIAAGLIGVNLLLLAVQGCCRKALCKARYSISIAALDNGGLHPTAPRDNQVYAKALLLKVHVEENAYYCNNGTPGLIGIGQALAMCKEQHDQYLDDSISIYTDRDFDAQHAAGDNLIRLFRVKGEEYYLMSAPDDTSGTYRFTVQLSYKTRYRRDTALVAVTPQIKLLK